MKLYILSWNLFRKTIELNEKEFQLTNCKFSSGYLVTSNSNKRAISLSDIREPVLIITPGNVRSLLFPVRLRVH